MSLAAASRRGRALKARLSVNGIQKAERSFGSTGAASSWAIGSLPWTRERHRVSRRGQRGGSDAGAADAGVGEAAGAHVLRLVDVAQVDHQRRPHQQLDAVEVERPELVPL